MFKLLGLKDRKIHDWAHNYPCLPADAVSFATRTKAAAAMRETAFQAANEN